MKWVGRLKQAKRPIVTEHNHRGVDAAVGWSDYMPFLTYINLHSGGYSQRSPQLIHELSFKVKVTPSFSKPLEDAKGQVLIT